MKALTFVQEIADSASISGITTLEGANVRRDARNILKWTNYVGVDIGRMFYWPWLLKRHKIISIPNYTTGTVAVTQGSKTVTGTGTTWTESMRERVFKTLTFREDYRIVEVASATSLVLDEEFNDTTATGLAYQISQDTYDLPPDFCTEYTLFQFVDPAWMRLVPPDEIDRRLAHPSGKHVLGPREATVDQFTDGRYVMVFGGYFDTQRQVRFTYYARPQKLAKDNDQWPFPFEVERVIHEAVLHFVRENEQDDARAQFDLQKFLRGHQDLSGFKPLAPRSGFQASDTGNRRLSHRRRRHTRHRRWDEGAWFDYDVAPI